MVLRLIIRTLFLIAALAALKARAIGIDFAGQQVDALPHDVHDWRLDAILTEQGLRRFA
ncbi:MAG TPA: hypothetical protein VGC27_11490 [Rhizomicrobium sp.]